VGVSPKLREQHHVTSNTTFLHVGEEARRSSKLRGLSPTTDQSGMQRYSTLAALVLEPSLIGASNEQVPRMNR
jgi:hypothetical protein